MKRTMISQIGGGVLIVGFVAGFALVWPMWKSKPLEALNSELTLRDGHLYRGAEREPFTGVMLERHENGRWKSRSMVVKGLLHGVSQGWHTNGQLQVREHFKHGISHGLRTKWLENGKILSETAIVEGQHHGTFRRWHENGQLAEQIEMKKGDPDGLSLAYYPSGFVKVQARLQDGHVVERQSWNDGELKQPLPANGTN